jgi:hypothetical protein
VSTDQVTCDVDGCERPVVWRSLGLCNAHGLRFYRYGSVFASIPVSGPRGTGRDSAKSMARTGARRWYEGTRKESQP